MAAIFIGGVVLIALVLIWWLGCARGQPMSMPQQGEADSGSTGQPEAPASLPTTGPIQSLSLAELRRMLAAIEAASSPEEMESAMCYATVEPEWDREYLCPTCGERTLYPNGAPSLPMFELEACRREFELANRLGRLTMVLDESSYCSRCRPDAQTQALALTVFHADGTKHTTAPVISSDFRELRCFLEGQMSYDDGPGQDGTLIGNTYRLRQLLGIPLEFPPRRPGPRSDRGGGT